MNTTERWQYIARELRKVAPDPKTGITSLTHEAARRGDDLLAINAELAKALETLLGKLDFMGGCRDYDMTSPDCAWPEFEKARTAIAKAKQ